jgi:hypothetical protein
MITKEQAIQACESLKQDILYNREELYDSPSFWLKVIDMCKVRINQLTDIPDSLH